MFIICHIKKKLFLFILIGLISIQSTLALTTANSVTQPNFLLIIADDLGVDALKDYNFSNNTAKTPNLDKLAQYGVTFENFWATPACTTTRGAIMTGKHGFESGIDYVPVMMPDSSVSIQSRLKQSDIGQSYVSGVFGKWHLGGRSPDVNHPARFGIDHYAGNLFNLDDYYDWELTDNGKQDFVEEYHTTKITDLALDFIKRNEGKPWFTWLAYSAPHKPFHQPPSHLTTTQKDFPSVTEKYHLMIESMDTEIGRLIANMPTTDLANTVIMFLGDNGSPKRTRDKSIFAKNHVKGSLYEGGIRTPLIVSGGPVTRKGVRESAMVNITDIFSTLVHFATDQKTTHNVPKNSISFRGLLDGNSYARRLYNYSEWKTKHDGLSWTVRDDNHKVIYHQNGSTELFFTNDISETTPLYNPGKTDALLAVGNKIRNGDFVIADSSLFKIITKYQPKSPNPIRCFKGDGLPNHDTGSFPNRGNPNQIRPQNINLCVNTNPSKNSSIDYNHRGSVGVALNGVQFRPSTADYYDVNSPRGFSRDSSSGWNLEGIGARDLLGIDHQNAHVDHRGLYHYHSVPNILKNNNNSLIGYAADGFEIHYANEKQTSSYHLKQGYRGTPPYGVHDGKYVEDWVYKKNSGSLDQCNGGTLNGKFVYFATSTYPFFPRCFWGDASQDFKTGQRGGQQQNHSQQGVQNHDNNRRMDRKNSGSQFTLPRFYACNNLSAGSNCSFETRRGHQRSGICYKSRGKELVCRSD